MEAQVLVSPVSSCTASGRLQTSWASLSLEWLLQGTMAMTKEGRRAEVAGWAAGARQGQARTTSGLAPDQERDFLEAPCQISFPQGQPVPIAGWRRAAWSVADFPLPLFILPLASGCRELGEEGPDVCRALTHIPLPGACVQPGTLSKP